MCFNLFVFLFLVIPCLVVAVHPCVECIPIKKNCTHVKKLGHTSEFLFGVY